MICFLYLFYLVIVSAVPLDRARDITEEQYYLVPIQRQRRDTAETPWIVSETGLGVGHKATVYQNDNVKLDASLSAGKNWNSHGIKPDQYTGRVDLTNPNTGSGAFIEANRVMGAGTDVNAGLKYNIYDHKGANVDLTGQYQTHLGGPSGNSRPDFGAMLIFKMPLPDSFSTRQQLCAIPVYAYLCPEYKG